MIMWSMASCICIVVLIVSKETGKKYNHQATKCLLHKNSQASIKQDQVNTGKKEQWV